MHNDTILQIAPTAVATTEQEPQASDPVFKDKRHPNAGGGVLAFPPSGRRVAADLKLINQQFFLMICDVQRGMLAQLSDIPRKLLAAAEKLVTPRDTEGATELWSRTLVLYVEALTDGRRQILATNKLHGGGASGWDPAAAIAEIEKAAPVFLRAVTDKPTDREALAGAAKALGDASRVLDQIFTGLLDNIERSIERAKSDGVRNQTGLGSRNS